MAVSNEFIELQQIKFDLFKAQTRETGQFDVAFEVEGKLLYAHRPMLTLVSPTFSSMLSDRWMKKEEPIKIKDYSYNNFYQFLSFLYSAQCELTDKNIYAMVDMAEFYGVELFKDYCDKYAATMTKTTDNIFKLIELAKKYSMIRLKASTHEFIITNFQGFANSDGFLNANKHFVDELVFDVRDEVKQEDLFLAVYKWSEKQAMDKQVATPNANLNDTIKDEIADILPFIKFKKMELKFLLEFVASHGFIFPSNNELNKILCRTVKVTDPHGQILHGNIPPDKTLMNNIKCLSLSTVDNDLNTATWWKTKYTYPSTPSLQKRDGIEWYLIYFPRGRISVIHRSRLVGTEYLLAEMTAATGSFQAVKGCKIEIQ